MYSFDEPEDVNSHVDDVTVADDVAVNDQDLPDDLTTHEDDSMVLQLEHQLKAVSRS